MYTAAYLAPRPRLYSEPNANAVRGRLVQQVERAGQGRARSGVGGRRQAHGCIMVAQLERADELKGLRLPYRTSSSRLINFHVVPVLRSSTGVIHLDRWMLDHKLSTNEVAVAVHTGRVAVPSPAEFSAVD